MVLEKIKVILAEQFDVEEDSIKPETDLQDDLGADSLDVVDLLMSIEDEFEIEIPDEEIAAFFAQIENPTKRVAWDFVRDRELLKIIDEIEA